MSFKARALVLSLVALLLMGLVTAGAAYAGEPGPFWHHREAGAKGSGEEIMEASPEGVKGEGGEQIFEINVGGIQVQLSSASVQVSGILYNNELQGQAKLIQKYAGAKVVKPSLPECKTEIGNGNTVEVAGHLVWKWNGEATQLEQQPLAKVQSYEMVYTPANSEIEAAASELPKGILAQITFKGTCGLLTGIKSTIEGSLIGLPKPTNLESWSKALTVTNPSGGKNKQHFWDGTKFIGASAETTSGGKEAVISGQTKISPAQEVAVFEGHKPGYFGWKLYPSHMKGQTKKGELLKDGEDSVSCGETKASGEIAAAKPTVSLNSIYSECTAVIAGMKESATVKAENCSSELGNLEPTSEKSETAKGTITIGGKGCSGIVVDAETSKCTIKIPAQGPLSGVILTALGEGGTELGGEAKAESESSCSGAEKDGGVTLVVTALVVAGVTTVSYELYNSNVMSSVAEVIFTSESESVISFTNVKAIPIRQSEALIRPGPTNRLFSIKRSDGLKLARSFKCTNWYGNLGSCSVTVVNEGGVVKGSELLIFNGQVWSIGAVRLSRP